MPTDSDLSGSETSESEDDKESLKQINRKTGSADRKKSLKTKTDKNEGHTAEEKPDEYEHDSSDEEVDCYLFLFKIIPIF